MQTAAPTTTTAPPPVSEQQQSQQPQQLQQTQQQHQPHPPQQTNTTQPPPPPELSAIQYAQLQQLQFQQMQWQYLQQLQQQQAYLQQQQQLALGQTGGQQQFDPNQSQQLAATASNQYRSAYQSYGQYPTSTDQTQTNTDEKSNEQTQSQTTSPSKPAGRSRYHNDQHAPSVDPKDWNDSVTYPSKSNPDRYLTHRNYFSNIPPVINRLPRKPELKELVIKGRDFYTNNRDPRFYNPIQEAGWDNRAQVVKTPITGNTPHTSTFRLTEHAAYQQQQQQQLPNIEEAKEQFGHFPVLVDNGSASARPGSKLLVPFLHNWPPPFRFDYLKKHSRAPLSPFLASLNGYEVPPELYMSARQRQEIEQQQQLQQREQQGYPGSYPPSHDPSASTRPSIHSLDPIERARARANTHTTYWRTVPTEDDQAGDSSQRHERGGPQPKSSRPEWNGRHHLKPPQPRVGQTTAKKPPGRRDRTQQQLRQQQQLAQQQQQMQQWIPGQPLPPLLTQNGQPLLPPYFFYPNATGGQQQFASYPYDPSQFQQQYHPHDQQQLQPYDPSQQSYQPQPPQPASSTDPSQSESNEPNQSQPSASSSQPQQPTDSSTNEQKA